MDRGACNVVYLDRRARENETLRRDALSISSASGPSSPRPAPGYFDLGRGRAGEVQANLQAILSIFNEDFPGNGINISLVYVCGSGDSCLTRITQLENSNGDKRPTILLLDIPYDEEQRNKRRSREPRTPSPNASRRPGHDSLTEPSEFYGTHLLLHIAAEQRERAMSKLVIPVVLLSGVEKEQESSLPGSPSPGIITPGASSDPVRMVRYLDAGAIDVLTSPLSRDRVYGLTVHAYRAYKECLQAESSFLAEKRRRKLSWVGVDETKPYAYLREAMVSSLMGNICNPSSVVESIDSSDFFLADDRKAVVARAVGRWSFAADDFTDDELLWGALCILRHALTMPEVQEWKRTTDELVTFLLACRGAYNEFVLYHNFRHAVDVLQALFYFLLQIGTLPPYAVETRRTYQRQSAIATLLTPFHGLMLLISAIGHDVGHPGVNNAFLVALNAPLAQLYNDRSVLESFHCAAYSQILRRYWPAAFSHSGMRRSMINSILATDMGVHFQYMADLGNLQEKLAQNNYELDGWGQKQIEKYRDLTCGILIKCADISNVARKFDCAVKWAGILTDEFANQGIMEKELNIPTTLFGGPPERDNMTKMGESQISFMNIFARPLFESVTDILPAMHFSVEELLHNESIWKKRIEKGKVASSAGRSLAVAQLDGTSDGASPFTKPGNDYFDTSSTSAEPPTAVAFDSAQTTAPQKVVLNHVRKPSSRSGRTTARSSLEQVTNFSRPSSKPPSLHTGDAPQGLQTTAGPSLLQSRRSSKDVPLAPLHLNQIGTLQSSDTHNVSSSRRGSADASLTTILVTSKESSADTERPPTEFPRPESPQKTQSQPPPSDHTTSDSTAGRSVPSYPSAHSHAASSNTNTIPHSPSTQATSLFEGDSSFLNGESASTTSPSFPPNEYHAKSLPHLPLQEEKSGVVSMYGPDTVPPVPNSEGSPLLRQRSSRTGLRGLKFWKDLRRWKSPSPGSRTTSPNHVQ
ncbi:MAG: 3',5'-cyclic-nucleotide phosphodiesterase [Bogoriella megaspora]|nr:MAG: 3',5'-cyclic-nucleotide phosphodiesterase [Bogoriella megaspora]